MRKILICCLVIAVLILFAVLLFRILRDMFGSCENIREKMKGGAVIVDSLGVGQPCRNVTNISRLEGFQNFGFIVTNKYIRKNTRLNEIFMLISGEINGALTNGREFDNVKAVFVIVFETAQNLAAIQLTEVPKNENLNLVESIHKEDKRNNLRQICERYFTGINNFTGEALPKKINIIKSYKQLLKEISEFLAGFDRNNLKTISKNNDYTENFAKINSAFPILEKSSDNQSVRDSFAYINNTGDNLATLLNLLNLEGTEVPGNAFLSVTVSARKTEYPEDVKNIIKAKTIRNQWQPFVFNKSRNLIHRSAFYLSNAEGLIPYFEILTRSEIPKTDLADIFPNSLALHCSAVDVLGLL